MDVNFIFHVVYALSFFTMGVVVWIRIRPLMDMKLARAFRWLAAFGIIHSLYVWVDAFVFMGHIGPAFLVISTFISALSFAVLLKFGIEVIGIKKNLSMKIRLVSAILFLLWFLFYLKILSYENGRTLAEICSRYTLGLSGTFLTAYTLTRKRKWISDSPHISQNLFFTGVSFAFYGILMGIVPEADFFPASILNYHWFRGYVGLPVQAIMTLSAITITYFVVMALDVFNIFEKKRLATQINGTTRALEESEEKYRMLFEQTSDIVILAVPPMGRIVEANNVAVKMLGYSKEELIGLNIRDIIAREIVEKADHEWQAQVKGKGYSLLETIWVRKDGLHIPVEVSGRSLEVQGRTLFQLIGGDISGRSWIQEEIQWNNDTQAVISSLLHLTLENIRLDELLKRVVNLIFSFQWVSFESKGCIFLVEDNPKVLVMKAQKGLTKAIQKTCARLPFGRCLCGWAALTQEIQFGNRFDDCHEAFYKGISPHGYCCVPILFAGKTLGVINIYLKERYSSSQKEKEFLTVIANTLAGIIMRGRAEKAQKRLEWRYRELIEGVVDAVVWEADAQTLQFIFVSGRAEALLGYPVSQWLNEPHFWVDHIHPDDRQGFISFCQQATQEGRNYEFEYRMITVNGFVVWLRDVMTVEYAGRVIKEDSCQLRFWSRDVMTVESTEGKPVRLKGVKMNITQLKQMKEDKEKIQAQLLHAQKMEAIGILAGGVAHDFNNLLTSIQGYAELSLTKVSETDPLYRNLEHIHDVSLRAADFVRQLLIFSRKQPMKFALLNINTLADNLLKMFSRLISEDITIDTELALDLWTVRADVGNIEQVIMNLGVNARDAMPEGGKITIKTENVTLDEEYCKLVSEARPGKFVCLSIEDTGVGMDKETIQHIFEPFFSTKEVGRGTGFGLSVVYGIVKQHGGWIKVYSKLGQGSIFKVYLPAISASPKDKTKEPVLLQELQGNGERILLVEDEKGVREFATIVLGENGYVVFKAANAKEALDIFERERRKFHMVFSDVVLPDKSGLRLADQLLSHKPELLVLLSSGYTDQKSQRSVIRERKIRFLNKPYALADLLRAVKETFLERP